MNTHFFKRQLGFTKIESPAMALGCYSMSNSYGSRDESESIKVIQKAIDAGIEIIDTADYYGWGHNEHLVASALRGRRHQTMVSSKFGYVPSETAAFDICGDPAYVKKACDESLRRLKTDYLDLYFQHRVDPRVPIEDTAGAMADLVREGKVRFLGLCEASESTLRRAHAVHPITAVQAEYSLWTRDLEKHMMGIFDEIGVTLMAFSPLARGMLSGKIRSLDQLGAGDVRRKYPRFSAENFPKNVALVDQLVDIAKQLECTVSQLSLAWLYNKSRRVVAICGCDTLEFLDENLAALTIELTDERIGEISSIFEPGRVHGDRYHPALMDLLDRA